MFCFMLRHPKIWEQPWDSAVIKGPLFECGLNVLTCCTRAMVGGPWRSCVISRQEGVPRFVIWQLELMTGLLPSHWFDSILFISSSKSAFVEASFHLASINVCSRLFPETLGSHTVKISSASFSTSAFQCWALHVSLTSCSKTDKTGWFDLYFWSTLQFGLNNPN